MNVPGNTTDLYKCGNCQWLGDELGTELEATPDLHERLTPGDEVPAGECPKCRAFAYVIKPTPKIVCVVQGGVLTDILSEQHLDALLVDYDVDGVSKDQLTKVPQPKGRAEPAVVEDLTVELDPNRVQEIWAVLD